MNVFTYREAVGDSLRPGSIDSINNKKPKTFTRKVRIDSKGRILLPIEVRRNFGLEKDFELSVVFRLDKNSVILLIEENGQGGVGVSTGGCGSSGPGANPGPDPENLNYGGEEYG